MSWQRVKCHQPRQERILCQSRMLDKYRRTRNKRRRSSRKQRRATKRSHRFFTRMSRKHRKQRGGNFGRGEISPYALVDHMSNEDDGFYAPRVVTLERHRELLEESERA
jgi:hypothetical protein